MQKILAAKLFSLLVALALLPASLWSQTNTSEQKAEETATDGSISSISRDTMVVRSDDNQFQLFVFDRYTSRPRGLKAGTRVHVVSVPGADEGARVARTIIAEDASSAASSSSSSSATVQTGSGPRPPAPVPPEVRDLESDIKRQARRWRLGVRAGVGMDPELLLFGVHSQIGPIFNKNVIFRPNAEFAFGELTDLVALNLEGIYRMPGKVRSRNWTPYVGAGPAMTFLHQGLEKRNIDFGNFDFNVGINVLAGAQYRNGTFVELKTSLWSRPAPVLRVIFGYNF